MRVLICRSSAFWMSREAVLRARELGAGWAVPDYIPLPGESYRTGDDDTRTRAILPSEVPRHDPILLQVFDELGEKMEDPDWSSPFVALEIPDDTAYHVESYCEEWIAQAHTVWGFDCPEGAPKTGPVFTKDSRFV